MTHVTALLIGWLTIASFVMGLGSRAVLRGQIQSGDVWPTSRAMQLSTALAVHGFSSIPAFVATLVAADQPQLTPVIVMLWTTWSGWLLAKTLVIRIVGRLEVALCLYVLWVPVWYAWRFGGL